MWELADLEKKLRKSLYIKISDSAGIGSNCLKR